MRMMAVDLKGIGGLPDGRVELPKGPIAALAGSNGTGKTKFLACLLAPWSQVVPSARKGEAADVTVHFQFTTAERTAISNLSDAAGWGAVDVAEQVAIRVVNRPLVGMQLSSQPHETVLDRIWSMQEFLQAESSLNVVYLPAERRLLSPNQSGIDLNQLSELFAWQKTAEATRAIQNYGRLDDQEFEQFAKALCVSHTLPSEGGTGADAIDGSRLQWPEFVQTVDALIAPKRLLPLTREHPDELRIETSPGQTHTVQDLSSGERQALIIISRVLRAGSGHTVVLIDEPDAYLHPHLSQRLIQALEQGVGADGQLIVATHSPSILDGVSPSAILRLSHDEKPRLVADEAERVDLYRSAGFRASALTQSDLLLITEGESDVALLSLLFPVLARASVKSAGGRARVVREVELLTPYELPVLGVVDGDLVGQPPPDGVLAWPSADIEGVFLADDAALESMVSGGLTKAGFNSVSSLRDRVSSLCAGLRENVIAELAQNALRADEEGKWPTPRGEAPLDRLRHMASVALPLSAEAVEVAITGAEALWDAHSHEPLKLVRGKYVLNRFASEASEMKSGRALLEAVARARPKLAGFEEFTTLLAEKLRV